MKTCSSIEKTYPLVRTDATNSFVRLKLDFPQQDGNDWKTLISTESPHGLKEHPVYQVDSLGSLFSALWLFRIKLEMEKTSYGLWDIPDYWPPGVFEEAE